jgi:hypothetical protein
MTVSCETGFKIVLLVAGCATRQGDCTLAANFYKLAAVKQADCQAW